MPKRIRKASSPCRVVVGGFTSKTSVVRRGAGVGGEIQLVAEWPSNRVAKRGRGVEGAKERDVGGMGKSES
jgi:hypothetical protein